MQRTQEIIHQMAKDVEGRGAGESNTGDEEECIPLWRPLLSAVYAGFVGAVVVWFTAGPGTVVSSKM